jgi:FlaA1/EpsC-like NDP-sugar epimerase
MRKEKMNEEILKDLTNKRILVTGGAGSIGQAVVAKLLEYNPQVVRVLDISEYMEFEMQNCFNHYPNVRYLLGDIRDKDRLDRAMENIDIVFHTASFKHVLACEYNPFEAVKSNVVGTQNLLEVAINHNVEKFIFTSSDKAVNPCNVMGATKLLAEKLVTAANYYKGSRRTVFSCVRFGNVLGSSGSVINLFHKQIKAGKELTLTDPSMTRFIMSLSQAVNLLLNASMSAQGGEIFIFKMPSVKLLDFAEALIEELAPKYGYNPVNYPIKVIGKKPGEKLYEELLTESESDRSYETDDWFVVFPELMDSFSSIQSCYPLANPAQHKAYTSYNSPFLLKAEIRRILRDSGLLNAKSD